MEFYNIDGNIVEYDVRNSIVLGEGDCARVYACNNNLALKLYFDYTEDMYRIHKPIFDVIRNYKNPHIINLDSLLFNSPLICNTYFPMVAGYTSQIIQKDDISVIEQNIDYILNNMDELSKMFQYFTNFGIQIEDMKFNNTIINSSGIICIDTDLWHKSFNPMYLLNIYNKKQLLELFKDICEWELIKLKIYDFKMYHKLCELFRVSDIDLSNGGEIDIIHKKLKKYKYPIDFFIND